MSTRDGYQAIITKYLGPGNVRGARVKATAAAGSVTLGWDHRLNSEDNHRAAAKALADKFDWQGELFCGGLPDGRMCFVTVYPETRP
jgi:hypothetical protein